MTTAKRDLTTRQRQILNVIRDSLASGNAPTIRGIMAAVGINYTNGVVGHIRALQKKGYLGRDPWWHDPNAVAYGVPAYTGTAPLTSPQAKLLNFVRCYITEHGYGPTMEIAAKSLGFNSRNTIMGHVRRLRIKGYLAVPDGKAVRRNWWQPPDTD